MAVDSATSLLHARAQDIDLPWRSLRQALDDDAQTPILVFIGPSLDAWGWRLLDELASDAEVIELIGSQFVPVLADSDEDPGLAALAQLTLALSANASGWPCILTLLPDGRPLGALPWVPIRDRDRRAGLATVLLSLAQGWHDDREGLLRAAEALASPLASMQHLPSTPQRPANMLFTAGEAACLEGADTLEGGFGDAPRSLNPAALEFLAYCAADNDAAPAVRQHLITSLDAMLLGGIHDQLAGGFHRAAQDRTWDKPFFEKRCLDQGLMAQVLLLTSRVADREWYGQMALRTLEWAAEELLLSNGGWAHGLHALSPGGDGAMSDGAAYAWSEAAAAAVVGRRGASRFARRFLTAAPLRDAFIVPNGKGMVADDDHEHLPNICARLAAARRERPQPHVDRRQLLRDQGVMLAAMAALLDWLEPTSDAYHTWRQRATATLHCIHTQFIDGAHIPRISCDNTAPADSGALAWLAWGWLQIAPHVTVDREQAISWAAALWSQRRDDGSLPFHLQPKPLPGDTLPAVMDNDHGPSAAAIAGRLFAHLGASDHPQATTWAQRSQAFFASHSALCALSPMPTCGILAAWKHSQS
ncbi:MAG: thioredoxin domain-containing protein [Planctomycetota bacterium]|nr:MAG: thioredoxin domain-containing protein [Planctomycetota bacterium]